MKHLVVKDVVEDVLRGWVGMQNIAVDGEAARRRLLGDVEEGEHRVVGFASDVEVVEAVCGVRRPCRRCQSGGMAAALHTHRGGAAPEERAVALLVGGGPE